ncbi:toprim domain-containing protein [Paenibacillus humicus]|uniref:toprim domain-containing protein n=1 Tax=Paenibacillus humicus TaxID=412861 RepID=UPI0013E30CEA|nr:toprim domain-containing protein [Paenibacillus humicus]
MRSLSIQIRDELEGFAWHRAKWYADRLVAASPFRYDSHPSFRVEFEHGYWTDSGASDPEWQRGGFVKLLAYLRQETIGETLEYLREKYGAYETDDDEAPTLDMPLLGVPAPYIPLEDSVLGPYQWRHPYLAGRGINEAAQRLCGVGYDRDRQAIVIPIRNANGTLANVKFRRVDAKTFWYAKGGRPIRECLFGIDVIHARQLRRVAIVEAEVDAMTLMCAGIPAVATLGAAWNEIKAEMIRNSPIEELLIIRDNDSAGRKWQREVIRTLAGDVRLTIVPVPIAFKDVNEAGAERMTSRIARGRRIRTLKLSVKGA